MTQIKTPHIKTTHINTTRSKSQLLRLANAVAEVSMQIGADFQLSDLASLRDNMGDILGKYDYSPNIESDAEFVRTISESQAIATLANNIFNLAADPFHASDGVVNQIERAVQQTDLNREVLQRHFFELLELSLAGIDSVERKQRGVFYTPAAVTNCLLNSVERELRETFNIRGGLTRAENKDRVMVVDPACGHGIFLHDLQRRQNENSESIRIAGYEIRPATAVTGNYLLRNTFGTDRNLIRCLNPLEGPQDELIDDDHILAIVGNPPYSNFGKLNRTPWILSQLDQYKHGLSEKKINLNDDFIKFICWAEHHIAKAGRGVLAFITGNTFFHGITHRKMRESLLTTFDSMYFFDLHGSVTKRELSQNGDRDENIFAIKQGVGIFVFVKSGISSSVYFGEILGSSESKLAAMNESEIQSLATQVVEPAAPHFHLVTKKSPQTRDGIALTDVFQEYISGVQTKQDGLFTDLSRDVLTDRMKQLITNPESFRGTIPDWIIEKAKQVRYTEDNIRRYMVAPLDVRWLYYDQQLLGRARWKVMQHMLQPNYGFVFMRQSTNPGEYDHFLATTELISDRVFYSAHGAPYLAPLFLYPDASSGRRDNFTEEFIRQTEKKTGLAYRSTSEDCTPELISPDQISALQLGGFIYGQFHSPNYRLRNSDAFRRDYPNIEIPNSPELFRKISQFGTELMRLHTSRGNTVGPSKLNRRDTTDVDLSSIAADQSDRETIAISQTHRVDNVPIPSWEFSIGGYQVLRRWLKQRSNSELTPAQLDYFENMVNVINQTRSIMQSIDLIDATDALN